jgi:radical SAM superfamily enzyme YgiQ (UPF0313 family)
MTKDAGIRAFSTFMLGLPTETSRMSEKTIRFALDSRLDYAIFPILEPYPGTEIYNDTLTMGYFLDEKGERVGANYRGKKTWVPSGRERKELERLAYVAMRRFYLRPRILFGMLMGMLFNLPPSRLLKLIYGGVSYFMTAKFAKVEYGTRY